MAKYLFIQTRDPYESRQVDQDYELAAGLAGAGNEVTMFLVQNGVLPTRRGAQAPGLQQLIHTGVQVLCDEFSLRERGIATNALPVGVQATALDVVVDQLAEGRKAIWL